MIQPMARKSYTDEFRRQAVDLYESTPGATLRGIAEDLGIARGTLADWVKTLVHYGTVSGHDPRTIEVSARVRLTAQRRHGPVAYTRVLKQGALHVA
jgi:transposase